MQQQAKWKRYGFYILGVLIVLLVGSSGVLKLIGYQQWIDEFKKYGYALWFMYFIGALQILGIGLWWKPARLWAVLGLGVIMLGAVYTNFNIGAYGNIFKDFLIIAFLASIIWLSPRTKTRAVSV